MANKSKQQNNSNTTKLVKPADDILFQLGSQPPHRIMAQDSQNIPQKILNAQNTKSKQPVGKQINSQENSTPSVVTKIKNLFTNK